MIITRLCAGLLSMVAATACASAAPVTPAALSAPVVQRTCYNTDPAFLLPVRIHVNGTAVDLDCGARIFVGADGQCWIEIADQRTDIPCTDPAREKSLAHRFVP